MTQTIRRTSAVALVGLLAAGASAQTPELYQFDVAHAELGFQVRLVGFNRVRGTFEDYRGDMLVVGEDPLRSAIGLSIDVKSVRTGVDERDEHLRSDAFFDAARWPRITFVSKRIERDGSGFAAIGPLTIRDVTREVRVPFAVTSPKGIDPFGNTRFSVAGRLTINRRDYEVIGPAFWNKAISDSVEIEFEMPGRRWDYNRLGWGPATRASGGKLLMDAIEKDGNAKATTDVWALFAAHRTDTSYNWSPAEFQKAAGRFAQQGKVSAAITVLELGLRVADAMALPRSSAALHTNLAELLLRDGNRSAAATHATSALARDSTSTAALMLVQFFSGQPSSDVRPPARSGFGLAFDTRRSRLVLFGGSDTAFQRLGDTWEWSGGRWARVDVPGPPARSDFAMAFDARRGRVVVFGGRTPAGLGRDTWEFDGARWTLVDSAGPSARALTSMTYDDARGRVVLFGGSAGSARMNDTWEWDGRAWTEVQAKNRGPAGRASHAMTYDAARRRVVLIGGYDEDAVGDSWDWDGKAWARAADGPEILHTAAVFDVSSNRILVFGGFHQDARTAQLWARTESGWTTLAATGPASRAEHRGVYAPGIGFVVFGGIGGQGMSVAERGRAKLNDLWAFDGARWNRLDP